MHTADVYRLVKAPLSLLIAFSALFGYAFGTRGFQFSTAVLVFVGTLLIVMGGAVLNNVQDRHLDAKMERTRVRPLPAQLMSVRSALIIASGCFVLGFATLSFLPFFVLIAGVVGIFLYNGFYTPMKRLSIHAIWPGALCGVAPPAMGWIASGRSLLEWDFLVLAMLLFTWQIPHFWLILIRRHKDYHSSGLPNMLHSLSEIQLRRIAFFWVFAFALVGSLLVSNDNVRFAASRIVVSLLCVGIGVSALRLFQKTVQVIPIFIHLNATLAALMLVIILDRSL